MDSQLSSNSSAALVNIITTTSDKLGASLLHVYDSVRLAAQQLSSGAVAAYYRTFFRNDSVNWGQVVFLATCLITMAGCGLLSTLLRRHKSPTKKSRFLRPSLRKTWTKSKSSTKSSKTLTSSDDDYEDDEYDSNGSLRHATAASLRKAAQWSSESEKGTCDALKTDPGILQKFSTYNSYTTSIATYPAIRTFFCPHPHLNRLPTEPAPVPLLVFVHGLGGSLAQFHHLLTSLSNVGSCFGIDLPGCGLSKFEPSNWDAYSVDALAELLATAIEKYRDRDAGQDVILVGHSLGCSLSALLASSTSPVGKTLKEHVAGLIAVCPKAEPPSAKEAASFRRLLHIPSPIFDLWRSWDRRGGIESTSVKRIAGTDADDETRDLQVRFNKQSRTPVWRRMAWGTLPSYDGGKAVGGIPGEQVWAGVHVPILLVAGEADAVTKPAEIQKLLKFFGDSSGHTAIDTSGSGIIPDASTVHDQASTPQSLPSEELSEKQNETAPATTKRGRLVKSVILPPPASHALLYDRATYRTLSGIIQDFLSQNIDQRLGMGWQLQYMNTSGKWDVKNLAKWQKVVPVSLPIANTFAAMKMLREVDEQHNPVLFSEKYRGVIHAVIDISHENPVYNPATMEKGGVHYVKQPTVSKIPPTEDEVRDFIALVDRLQGDIDDKVKNKEYPAKPRPLVGVHCHYGYNRTGFLITSYLVERLGFGVQDAIDEFNRCRPPGIRHAHFIDTLFVRYCVGLKRAPTL